LLGAQVKPVRPAPAALTRRLIAELDDDSFEQRAEVQKRLLALGARAESALRSALMGASSAEQKRRINGLLAALARPPELTGEQWRDLRAAEVLGWVGTPEARKVLRSLGTGVGSAPLTQQARSALTRTYQK
jgi:hypothetical protein